MAPLIRAVATEADDEIEPPLVGCWVNPGWSDEISVPAGHRWPEGPANPGTSGLVSVLVVREQRRGRVSVYGYLVDVFCLGVKDVVGPRVMDPHALPTFVRSYYEAYEAEPLAVPLELAQQLVFGAVEYARTLGFDPAPDFTPAAVAHLGTWAGPSRITFGRHGKPLFIQGPRDNVPRVLKTLERSIGRGNFDYLAQV